MSELNLLIEGKKCELINITPHYGLAMRQVDKFKTIGYPGYGLCEFGLYWLVYRILPTEE